MSWLKELKIESLERDEATVIPKECKGLFYRGYESTFYTGGRLETRMGIRLLKSKSCSGCPKCAHYDEYLNESPELVSGITEIKHGALYSLTTHVSRDWESGIVDDWDVEIVEVEE